MNLPEPPLKDRIRQSIGVKDNGSLLSVLKSAIQQPGRRGRRERILEINAGIVESALELDRPDLLLYLQDLSHENLGNLFSTLLNQYIRTRNDAWFDATIALTRKLEKKSDQSGVQARLCQMLIEAGSVSSDRQLIERGISLFTQISFRKYQSGLLSQISPVLIDWAVKQEDTQFLRSLHAMTTSIADVSGKSEIHVRIATAMAAIGIAQGELAIWAESIRIAAGIRQKSRRQNCIGMIVSTAVPSPLFGKIRDILDAVSVLPDVPENVLHEVIASVLNQVLTQENDHDAIRKIISDLVRDMPSVEPTIVAVLLNRTENTGDSWFFSQAIGLQSGKTVNQVHMVREFVKAALAVFRTSGGTDTLHQVVPAVVASCTPATASRILLRIVQVLLDKGELSEALSVFVQAQKGKEKNPLYDECSTTLIKHAIVANKITQVQEMLAIQPGNRQWSGAIYRAVADICKQHAFSVISANADTLAVAMTLHPQRDQLVLDSITFLIRRGFLETSDPDVLIRLTRSIGDSAIRERALSNIVIRVAKLGVATRSRDYLQRAVGLSCLIEETRTRSLTLTAVIDEATMLAVDDGDIGLLRRMREWSASLLSRGGESVAFANIIDGMITYAGNLRCPAALDEAYEIAQEIQDLALKKEITDRIIESYVRIGCLLVYDLGDPPGREEFTRIFRLFLRGLEILTKRGPSEEQSLMIAHIIDIILDSSKERFRIDLVPALILFDLEIREATERDAMAIRIASFVRTLAGQPESTDPYESIVQVLLRVRCVTEDPILLDLLRQTVDQIKDPFVRYLQLCHLARLYLVAGKQNDAQDLLDRVRNGIEDVSGQYRQVILLSECTIHYTRIAQKPADTALNAALAILQSTDYDPDAVAARHLIEAIARFNTAYSDEKFIGMAQEIASRINDPGDLADALLPVYRMAVKMPKLRHSIVHQLMETADAIDIPIQKVPLLLNLAEEMIRYRDTKEVSILLVRGMETASQVQISFLADSFRNRIAGLYIQLYKETDRDSFLVKAEAVIAKIGHEEIRLSASGLHEKISAELPPLYLEIKNLAERMVAERYNPAQVIGLENLVRSVQDRSVIARYFCTIAIIFNSTGKTRLARHFHEAALSEASVVRPLSRRAYVLCDLALILDAAGCRTKAQALMDRAIDAATGIRQFSDRDEVFDGLAAAMRWMRED